MNNRIRRMMGCIALALACVMIGSAMSVSLTPAAQAESNTTYVVHTSPFTQAIAQVRDSVVGVSNYQKVTYRNYGSGYGSFFGYGYGSGGGRSQEPETREELASTGSGVVVGEGFVLTNYHVVEEADKLKVTVTDDAGETTEYAASLVAWDESLDAAVLYAPDCKLPPVALGDSDALMVGDWAICIGNPLGFAKTTTVGIVSALGRGIESESYDKYGRKSTITNAMIQVDAAINSGNSGGGMFSVTGELMGIPTLKYTGSYYSGASVEGIGMCIPVNAVKPLIDSVLTGEVKAIAPEKDEPEQEASDLRGKPRLGVTIADVNMSSRAASLGQIPDGVFITEVEEGSPAEKAGLIAGDIIVDVNDTIITDDQQLITLVGQYNAGDVLHIKVYRAEGLLERSATQDAPEGEYIDVEVTLEVIASDTEPIQEDEGLLYAQ
ncbi:MAG: trypsin-like peptidase domain-containing protein [Clostridia bacterium]|nr:trypsin-like peptidase domain-containing protein [Clostridia bacterium]